jgi:hypothetical protein
VQKKIVVVEKKHPNDEEHRNNNVFVLEKSDNFHNSKTKLGK